MSSLKNIEAFYDRGSSWIIWGSSLKELHVSPEKSPQQDVYGIPMDKHMAHGFENAI